MAFELLEELTVKSVDTQKGVSYKRRHRLTHNST